MTSGNFQSKFDFLTKAIEDTQNTIRFTDTKAVAVIGFWTLVITVLFNLKADIIEWIKLITNWYELMIIIIIILTQFFFFIKSMWLAYLVLVPKNNPNLHINKGGIDVKGLFYLDEMKPNDWVEHSIYKTKQHVQLKMSTNEYITALKSLTDEQILQELTVELQKLSFIRAIKIARVNAAITSIMYFVLGTFVFGLFWFLEGSNLFRLGVNYNLLPLHVNVELFIVLFIAHKIADYVVQTDKQATLTDQQWIPLIIHCFIYTVIVLGAAYLFTGFFNIVAILLVFTSHVIIDHKEFLYWWARKVKGIKDINNIKVQNTLNDLDQVFHYIVLFFISIMG